MDRLDLCTQQPATYTEATDTYSVGHYDAPVLTPGTRPGGGHQLTVTAISGGDVTGTDTPTHWALTLSDYDGSSWLFATGPITNGQVVTAGNTFSLGSFTVQFPAATEA